MARRRRASGRISVLLVPNGKGSTVTFHTTKTRLLLFLVSAFSAFGLLAYLGVSHAAGWAVNRLGGESTVQAVEYEHLYDQARARQEVLEQENEALAAETAAQARRFGEVVERHREQVTRFSALAGLPMEATEPAAATNSIVSAVEEGRGGPQVNLPPGVRTALERSASALIEADHHLSTLRLFVRRLTDINAVLEDHTALLRRTPLMAPVLAEHHLTDGFGPRRHPITGEWGLHRGLDFAAPHGTPVVAVADGVVAFAGRRAGYGRLVILDHGEGLRFSADEDEVQSFNTRYGHLSAIEVEEGQRVTRGQEIGLVGSTGQSTGAHLHYEVRVDGEAVNPEEFIVDP